MAGLYILREVRMNLKKQTNKKTERRKEKKYPRSGRNLYIFLLLKKKKTTVYIRNNFPKRFVGKSIVCFVLFFLSTLCS